MISCAPALSSMWPDRNTGQRGFTLIEVLISFLIVTLGLLGLAALQTQTVNEQFESLQYAQATLLVDNMANRIRANAAGVTAGSYSSGSDYGLQDVPGGGCSGSGATLDLCEWNALIAGAAASSGGASLSAPIGARGCLSAESGSGSGETVVRVAIAWQGIVASAPPSVSCGLGAFGSEGLRRVVFRDVVVR